MNRSFLLLAAGLVAGVAQPALANDRYGTRPPVIVNSELTAPWVNQLGGGGIRPQVYAPPRRVQPQAQYYQQQQVQPYYQQRQTYQQRQPAPPSR